ncbi:MAG: helix-turn-helix domain-containing protein [Spirochaetales bacterium]|nr:helix-turn-helix domain-containing protein [Spirochaetales bacterium]
MYRRQKIITDPLKEIPYVRELGVITESAGKSLPMHRNDGFEIIYVFSGRYRWEMEDGHMINVRGRQLSLTLPQEAHHGYLDHLSPGEILYIVFDFDRGFCKGVPYLNSSHLRQLRSQLMNRGNGTFRVGEDVHSAAERLADLIVRKEQDKLSSLDLAVLWGEMNQFILRSVRAIIDTGKQTEEAPPLQGLLTYIQEHSSGNLSIEELERISGWGRTRLYALFHRYTGQTPVDYIQSTRCDQACVQLKESRKSITEISFDLGFSSSQYFSRVFKKYTGLTPGAYRLSSSDSPAPSYAAD